jgi:hypothetical protein
LNITGDPLSVKSGFSKERLLASGFCNNGKSKKQSIYPSQFLSTKFWYFRFDINFNKEYQMSYPHKQLHELLPDRWKELQNTKK